MHIYISIHFIFYMIQTTDVITYRQKMDFEDRSHTNRLKVKGDIHP